jgi:hypothetical protein
MTDFQPDAPKMRVPVPPPSFEGIAALMMTVGVAHSDVEKVWAYMKWQLRATSPMDAVELVQRCHKMQKNGDPIPEPPEGMESPGDPQAPGVESTQEEAKKMVDR